jgi:hypothetical protein
MFIFFVNLSVRGQSSTQSCQNSAVLDNASKGLNNDACEGLSKALMGPMKAIKGLKALKG